MEQGSEEFLKTVGEMLGEEKKEELHEDMAFFLKTFEDQINAGILAFNLMVVMCTTDEEIENAIKSTIISSIEFYRDWLSQKGIDVRKLEGR